MATDPNWTDIGIFWATVGGVTATFAAVLVALFGERFHQWRRRPKLKLQIDPESFALRVDDFDSAEVMQLTLNNARGRDTAREVEVFVTAYAEYETTTYEAAKAANLNFDDPLGDGEGRSTATVPSGFGRNVNLAVQSRDSPQDLADREAWGYLALYPPRLMQDATLYDGLEYRVIITITGANFDSLGYVGVLGFTDDAEPGVGPLKSLAWIEPPKRL